MTCAIRIPDLDVLLGGVWQGLMEAAVMRSHPFHHLSLATTDHQGLAQARRVVLQEAERSTRTLGFYADVRSPKVAELRARPAAALLFWDAGRRWQVRAATAVALHHRDEVTEQVIERASPRDLAFLAVSAAPGTAQSAVEASYCDPLTPSVALERLVVVRATVTALDVLQLHDEGPLRASYRWSPTGACHTTWLVP